MDAYLEKQSQRLEDLRGSVQELSLRIVEMQGMLRAIESSMKTNEEDIKELQGQMQVVLQFKARHTNVIDEIDALKSFMWRVVGGISLGIVLIEGVVFFLATKGG